jgi:hypothetical protein
MSVLETRVMPLLGAMMRDVELPLSPDQQKDLSLWAVKTAMVNEGTKPKELARCFLQADREALRVGEIIPPRTHIEVGRFERDALNIAGTDFWPEGLPETEGSHGSVTTMIIGHVVIQVVTVSLQPEYSSTNLNLECAVGIWDQFLHVIWPVTKRINWPPPLSFTNDGGMNTINRLFDRFKLGKQRTYYPGLPDDA